ncbi:hypothetical protein CBA19CS22_28190 [Caballeronia novacaledonica]|uniref:Uncharacterized protein n=1 Tax=Caballeronia novacaledonica TaxID=1544861 RepID=A0ACB5QZX2_9BURK|nr:hypothetical protein CBA19CS22_28190 [Caballeronia novacaledonica]
MGSSAALPASSAARAAQLPNVRVCIDFLKQELAHGEFALWKAASATDERDA